MSTQHIVQVEPGNRIKLPPEWADALGLHGLVALEWTDKGIFIRPHPQLTWDDIFATPLQAGSAPPDDTPEDLEVTGDDFLF